MAIDKFFTSPPTDTLAYDKNKVFYPLRIPISHWQLRHFISVPASASPREHEEDVLYYAGGPDVYCLNTKSRKRRHITNLPFEARCTASGYGWVCVGGDDEGRFAALKLDNHPTFADVDDRIPGLASVSEERRNETRRQAPNVKVERIGEDIVNSISIHRLTCPASHLEDTVAVLTNNDKTVRVYSLTLGVETCVKDLPFPMNHATISPCGTMLVAVGDEPQAFFFRREMLKDPPQIPKPHNRLNSNSVGWRLTNAIDLHVSTGSIAVAGGSTPHPKGYFTTAWSSNSKLCAVGSEGGYTTVFDTDLLSMSAGDETSDEDAIVALVPGSRPDIPTPHPGAIRSMLFSPHPWDLLFWTEDQGRMCIGDLRTGLRTRQVVELETKEGSSTRANFTDVEDEEDLAASSRSASDRRRGGGNNDDQWDGRARRRTLEVLEEDAFRFVDLSAGTANYAHQYLEAQRRLTARRRQLQQQQQQQLQATGPTPPQGLTAREQELLDSLRTTRHREELRAAAAGTLPAGINYPSADTFSIAGEARTLDDDGARLLRRARNVLSLASTGSSISSASRMTPSTEPSDQDATEDEEAWRPIERIHSRSRRAEAERDASPPDESAARSPRSANGASASGSNSGSIATRRDPSNNNNLQRQHSMMYPPPPSYAAYESMFLRRQLIARNRNGHEAGPRTTGLALSQDGRTLFAACEEGIFELEVNLKGRMFWKAAEMR